jgi:hypothetical protein
MWKTIQFVVSFWIKIQHAEFYDWVFIVFSHDWVYAEISMISGPLDSLGPGRVWLSES